MEPRRRRLAVISAVAVVVAVGGGWALSRSSDDVDARLTTPGNFEYPTIGTSAQNTGKSLEFVPMVALENGNEVTPRPQGRPLVVNFWFSTCEPCKREMPALSSAATRFAGKVDFIGINPNDTPESAAPFLEKVGVSYPNYLDDGDQLSAAGVATMPTTIFLDASGRIVERHSGELSLGDITDTIGRLFGAGQ